MTDFPNGNGNGNGNGHAQPWPQAGVGTRTLAAPRREAVPKRVLGTVGFLLDASTRRRGGRLTLRAVVVALALGGVWLLAYPVITNIWADRIQNRLEKEFQASAPTTQAGFRERQPAEGSALTRLVIPKLKVNVIVVEGTSGNALRAGAGHYPNTALPGDQTGNVAIAGHRTGFGEPFRHLDKLKTGDIIELHTPYGVFKYSVMPPFDGHKNPWITHAKDWSVIHPTAEPVLTLTTCDPPGTSKYRLIVRARLVTI